MANNNNNTRLPENESNLPANQQDMNQMYYRPNEANFNYKGVTFNVNIPMFIENIKKLIKSGQEKKAMRELRELEQKTKTNKEHHNLCDDILNEVLEEDD